MQKIYGLVLSCALMVFGCGSTGAAGGGASQNIQAAPSEAAPVAKSAADACVHLEELAGLPEPWSESAHSQCQSGFEFQSSVWEPKVGEGVIRCILDSTDPKSTQYTCGYGAVAKSLGLGYRKSNLSIADACTSLRDRQAREEPEEWFDGPGCERDLAKKIERWQPTVVQALLLCTVTEANSDFDGYCTASWLATELGIEHPDGRKVKRAYANMSLLMDQITAYYAANSRLPIAVAKTPSKDCCSQGGQCQPNASDWDIPGWKALSFKIETPHYYSYRIEMADFSDGKGIYVIALGDIDCDGSYATFKMYGEVMDGKIESSRDVLIEGGRYE